jgi:hypothetical protein
MVQVLSGRVVLTRDEPQPYKVVLQVDGVIVSERPATSLREAEALIREKCASGPAIAMDPRGARRDPDPWIMEHCSRWRS